MDSWTSHCNRKSPWMYMQHVHQHASRHRHAYIHVCPLSSNTSFHAQYLNIDLTRLDFIDTILDNIKASVQLVWLQQTHPAYTCCEQDEHSSPTGSSFKPSDDAS